MDILTGLLGLLGGVVLGFWAGYKWEQGNVVHAFEQAWKSHYGREQVASVLTMWLPYLEKHLSGAAQ